MHNTSARSQRATYSTIGSQVRCTSRSVQNEVTGGGQSYGNCPPSTCLLTPWARATLAPVAIRSVAILQNFSQITTVMGSMQTRT